MNTTDAIRGRRSVKRFADRLITREEMEKLLTAATLAPNHRLTQPWRFYVLGPEARYGYGLALGNRKAKKIEDPEAARATREAVAQEHRALPGMIVVTVVKNDNPEIRDEDYAATMMGIQNLALTAVELGLATHLKTGATWTTRPRAPPPASRTRIRKSSRPSMSACRLRFHRKEDASWPRR